MGEGMDRAPSVEHNWVTRDAARFWEKSAIELIPRNDSIRSVF